MALFTFKLAGGGGFNTPVAAVHDVKRHKQPGKAVVLVWWGRRHKRTGTRAGLKEMVAVGDWKKLRARWKALRGAG